MGFLKLCDIVKNAVSSFFEWQDAMYWARAHHPGWVYLATRCKTEETRKYFRDKILEEYRRADG